MSVTREEWILELKRTDSPKAVGAKSAGACSYSPVIRFKQKRRTRSAAGADSVDSIGPHGVAPAQSVGVTEVEPSAGNPAGLDEGAELEVDRVHVGGPARKVGESAIRVPA